MLTYQFQTMVSADGSIPLVFPEDLRGLSITLNVFAERKTDSTRTSKRGILALKGILEGYTREELEKNKEEYLSQKYDL